MCNVSNHTIWCNCHNRPSLKEQLAQARREGWEQGKRECMEILKDYCKREMAAKGFGKGWQSLAADAIAAMEYGEKKENLKNWCDIEGVAP